MIFKRTHRPSNIPRDPAAIALNRILLKCDYRLDRVVEYILAATQDAAVCNYCAHKADMSCVSLTSCAAAVAEYLKEHNGNE